jgi:hypothetical protein
MARLVIDLRCDDDAHYRGAEIAFVLLRFIAKITSWGMIPANGRPIDLIDSQGVRVGSARLEDD